MKSENNKTEFDDKLFYQAIISSLEKLLIFPAKNIDAELKRTGKTLKIIHDKCFQVLATAPGTVQIGEKTIRIEHENGISTVYSNVVPAVKDGVKIKQGEIIGQSVKFCELKIEIKPFFLEKK